MHTRLVISFIFLALSGTSYAQSLSVGDYLVVRGVIVGCEEWKDRILDVQEIEDEGPIGLLGLPAREYLGMTAAQIRQAILSAIATATGRTPTSLQVEILTDETHYKMIVGEYGASLNALIKDKCPFKAPIDPLDPIERSTPLGIAGRLV